METLIQRLKDRFMPHPKGFTISLKVSLIYAVVAVLLIAAALIFGDSVIATMVLAIAGCGYIVMDVGRSINNGEEDAKKRRKHTIFTIGAAAVLLVFCLVVLLMYVTGMIG